MDAQDNVSGWIEVDVFFSTFWCLDFNFDGMWIWVSFFVTSHTKIQQSNSYKQKCLPNSKWSDGFHVIPGAKNRNIHTGV